MNTAPSLLKTDLCCRFGLRLIMDWAITTDVVSVTLGRVWTVKERSKWTDQRSIYRIKTELVSLVKIFKDQVDYWSICTAGCKSEQKGQRSVSQTFWSIGRYLSIWIQDNWSQDRQKRPKTINSEMLVCLLVTLRSHERQLSLCCLTSILLKYTLACTLYIKWWLHCFHQYG